MLFTALYEIPMETLRECQDRFMNQEEQWYGVKLLHRLHHAHGNTGVLILESDDAQAIGQWANQWADLLSLELTPAYDDKAALAILGG